MPGNSNSDGDGSNGSGRIGTHCSSLELIKRAIWRVNRKDLSTLAMIGLLTEEPDWIRGFNLKIGVREAGSTVDDVVTEGQVVS